MAIGTYLGDRLVYVLESADFGPSIPRLFFKAKAEDQYVYVDLRELG